MNLLEHSLWTLPQGYNFTFDQSRCDPGRRVEQKAFDTTWSRHVEWLSDLRDFNYLFKQLKELKSTCGMGKVVCMVSAFSNSFVLHHDAPIRF